MAMMCRALLAARSPPRFNLCRIVLPDDAGTGLVPQRAAKVGMRKPAALIIHEDVDSLMHRRHHQGIDAVKRADLIPYISACIDDALSVRSIDDIPAEAARSPAGGSLPRATAVLTESLGLCGVAAS